MHLSPLPVFFSLLVLGVQATPSAADETIKSLGCYKAVVMDSHDYPPFKDPIRLPDNKFNSRGSCEESCMKKGNYRYAAVHEVSCYCGSVIKKNAKMTKPSECNINCPGFSQEKCGGYSRVNILELKQ